MQTYNMHELEQAPEGQMMTCRSYSLCPTPARVGRLNGIVSSVTTGNLSSGGPADDAGNDTDCSDLPLGHWQAWKKSRSPRPSPATCLRLSQAWEWALALATARHTPLPLRPSEVSLAVDATGTAAAGKHGAAGTFAGRAGAPLPRPDGASGSAPTTHERASPAEARSLAFSGTVTASIADIIIVTVRDLPVETPPPHLRGSERLQQSRSFEFLMLPVHLRAGLRSHSDSVARHCTPCTTMRILTCACTTMRILKCAWTAWRRCGRRQSWRSSAVRLGGMETLRQAVKLA